MHVNILIIFTLQMYVCVRRFNSNSSLAALQAVSVIKTLIIQKVRTFCGHVLSAEASMLHFLGQKQTKQEAYAVFF